MVMRDDTRGMMTEKETKAKKSRTAREEKKLVSGTNVTFKVLGVH